jgi:hypothetical protein
MLVEKLKRSSDFSLSKDICNILGKIKHPEAIPYLKERVDKSKEPNANVRYAAYEALELIGTDDAKEIISNIYVIDPIKLKGNEPFEHTLPDGTKVWINEDGKHPGMVKIPWGDKTFWIDVYPITNKEFEQVFPEHKRSKYSPYDDSPVTLVTWEQAVEYAKKIGKRLPTEEEWEKAAKGPKNWQYSFGNEFDINKCRVELPWVDGSSKINTVYNENVNGYGVYDMSGNIWEWISEEYIRKGGSWIDESARCFCGAHDGRRGVVGSSGRVGFRCCQ